MTRLTVLVTLALAWGLVAQGWGFSYSEFTVTELADFQLNGNAASLNPNGDKKLGLTSNWSYQVSSAFLKNTVALPSNYAFDTIFVFKTEGAADGLTFTIQIDPRGAYAIGREGGSIGYGAPSQINPSVTVEFDIYVNPLGEDPQYKHVAIMKKGFRTDHLANVQEDNLGSYVGLWTAWIDYDGANMHVYYSTGAKPGTPQITYAIDLATILYSTNVYLGFTGSTGAATGWNEIYNWEFNAVPLPPAAWLFGAGLLGLAVWRRRR
jgi:hypothetical protein